MVEHQVNLADNIYPNKGTSPSNFWFTLPNSDDFIAKASALLFTWSCMHTFVLVKKNLQPPNPKCPSIKKNPQMSDDTKRRRTTLKKDFVTMIFINNQIKDLNTMGHY